MCQAVDGMMAMVVVIVMVSMYQTQRREIQCACPQNFQKIKI